jgi:hypothetical protein
VQNEEPDAAIAGACTVLFHSLFLRCTS